MTIRRVNSHSAKDLNVCNHISPKADIKAADQVQKYLGCTLLRSLRTTHAYSDTHIQTSTLDLVVFSSFSLNKQYIKRGILHTADSVSSLLCCRNTTRARRHEKQHIYLLLFVYSFVCLLFSDTVSHSRQAMGYSVMVMLSACVCLLVYLFVLA